jgi:hypothetical protein
MALSMVGMGRQRSHGDPHCGRLEHPDSGHDFLKTLKEKTLYKLWGENAGFVDVVGLNCLPHEYKLVLSRP